MYTVSARLLLVFSAIWVPVSAAEVPLSRTSAVKVSRVVAMGVADRAGLRAGDGLLGWKGGNESGAFQSPLDVRYVELQRGVLGPVTVLYLRQGTVGNARLEATPWGMEARPRWSEAIDRQIAPLAEQLAGGGFESAAEGLEGLSLRLRGVARACLLGETSDILHRADHPELAEALFSKALSVVSEPRHRALLLEQRAAVLRGISPREALPAIREAEAAWALSDPDSPAHCAALIRLGQAQAESGGGELALQALQHAVAVCRENAPGTRLQGTALLSVGSVLQRKGDLKAAESALREAIALLDENSQDSPELSKALAVLGGLLGRKGAFDEAERLLDRSLEIREAAAPGQLASADVLNALGVLSSRRGDLTAAEGFYRRALAIRDSLAPGTREAIGVRTNLGTVLYRRGDLQGAETYHRAAVEFLRENAPGSREHLVALNNLGITLAERRQNEAAEALYLEALNLMLSEENMGADLAPLYQNLGDLAEERGDSDSAESYFKRAIDIQISNEASPAEVAANQLNLGGILLKRGDHAGAETLLKAATAVYHKDAPGSVFEAESLGGLAGILEAKGDWAGAEDLRRQETAILDQMAPQSHTAAEAHRDLSSLLLRRGRREEAMVELGRALHALEAQENQVGGGQQGRSTFGARYAPYYRDAIDLQVELGRDTEAFETLERSRGRLFLAMLAGRHMDFSADLSPEFARRRRLLAVERDRLLEALAELSPEKEAEKYARTREQLSALSQSQASQDEEIRARSPRLAALQKPKTLTFAEAQAAVEPGTLLLAFSTNRERTRVFALGPRPGEFSVHTLAIPERVLAWDVRRFLRVMQDRHPAGALATSLGRKLLGPVCGPLRRAKRLLLVADGPLHQLPFAALGDPSAKGHFLIERLPVASALSVTLYAETARASREVPSGSPLLGLAVFASPEPLPAAVRNLEPLPGSAREASAVAFANATPSGFAKPRVFSGREATEEAVGRFGTSALRLHFACHATMDPAFPLESAMVLAAPESVAVGGEENGLLQAWELFDRVRLQADLVVLSACETASGRDSGGEGLLGMARAFRYAGGREIVASLWPVSDEGTVFLMARLYENLAIGATTEEALRRAQLDLLRGRGPAGSTDAFHWAPFVLFPSKSDAPK